MRETLSEACARVTKQAIIDSTRRIAEVMAAHFGETDMPEADAPTTTKPAFRPSTPGETLVINFNRLAPEDRALVLNLAERLARPAE